MGASGSFRSGRAGPLPRETPAPEGCVSAAPGRPPAPREGPREARLPTRSCAPRTRHSARRPPGTGRSGPAPAPHGRGSKCFAGSRALGSASAAAWRKPRGRRPGEPRKSLPPPGTGSSASHPPPEPAGRQSLPSHLKERRALRSRFSCRPGLTSAGNSDRPTDRPFCPASPAPRAAAPAGFAF